mmetsp:Transcript_69846/g.221266  ORF Transcript_69846/g.221266 Transcript_69846/m.221266 type:complete len:221 (+) Transcript_69846:383-1045(+)
MCRQPHTVEDVTIFSVRLAIPAVGCWVRASNTWNWLSRVETTSLFIWMSFLSNSTPQTPFFTLVSHRTRFVRRSKSLTSPLSYPASTARSSSLNEFPNATVQQSLAFSGFSGSRVATGASSCRVSQMQTRPSRPQVASSGAPYPFPAPPQPSIELMIEVCACAWNTGLPRFSRSHTLRTPLKSPVASLLSMRPDAPNVPHLRLSFVSVSATRFSSVPATS